MKSKKIIIGSRGSKLALIYAERSKAKILEFAPNFGFEDGKMETKVFILSFV